jgi:hypothetical protein
LTAGDWDVDGYVYFFPANTTTVTLTAGYLSLVTNTTDTTTGRFSQHLLATATGNGTNFLTEPLAPYRFSLSSTTSIFLVAFSNFATSTSTAFGIIRARRVR